MIAVRRLVGREMPGSSDRTASRSSAVLPRFDVISVTVMMRAQRAMIRIQDERTMM